VTRKRTDPPMGGGGGGKGGGWRSIGKLPEERTQLLKCEGVGVVLSKKERLEGEERCGGGGGERARLVDVCQAMLYYCLRERLRIALGIQRRHSKFLLLLLCCMYRTTII
jgi:hypothetical protein